MSGYIGQMWHIHGGCEAYLYRRRCVGDFQVIYRRRVVIASSSRRRRVVVVVVDAGR